MNNGTYKGYRWQGRFRLWGVCLLLMGAAGLVAGAAAVALAQGKNMVKLTHACLITKDIKALKTFYQEVLQVEPKVYEADYVEFPTAGAILSLYAQDSLEKTVPGAMQAGANRSVMLEFEVADVDQEYARLKAGKVAIDWVMPPTTFPWGNRSIYFRDPEGNMINFFSQVKSP